jgi:hypothetical protein
MPSELPTPLRPASIMLREFPYTSAAGLSAASLPRNQAR